MKRLTVALIVLLSVMFGITATLAGAQTDPPPPTHTPTPTYTPTPDYTTPLVLQSGQPGRIVFEITAGDYLIGGLLFTSVLLQALILYTLQRNRLTED